MDRNHSRLVVILLAGIFLFLLHGPEAFLWACLGAIAGLVAIGLIGLIVWTQSACLQLLFGEDLRALAWSFCHGGPWLSQLVMIVGGVGVFVVAITAVARWVTGSCDYFCTDTIPYHCLPLCLLFGGVPLLFVEADLRKRFGHAGKPVPAPKPRREPARKYKIVR